MKRTNKMRYLVLVLLVCWLWNATSSKADDCISTFHCQRQSHADVDFMCEQEHTVSISAKCGKNNDGISMCNISIMYMPFCDQYYLTSMPTTDKPTTPAECKCTPVSENSESGATSVVTNTGHSTSNSSNLTITLGASVGLLLILLVVVTTGWMWTYWSMRERRRNSNQTRSNNIIESQINPCYNQHTLPVYESIPSCPKQDNKREGGKQGEDSYDILNREQLCTVMDSEIIHEEAKMFNYSKLELADNKIKPEKNPAYATTTQSDV